MRPFVIIGLIAISLSLNIPNSGPNNGYAGMTTEVNLKFTGEGCLINNDSRLIPDSGINNPDKGASTFEGHITVSDYVNDKQTLRWLFKGFNYNSSEPDAPDRGRKLTRIDELFMDLKTGNWFFSVGKRRINWGTAMGFNPVNVVVPPRDPLNPRQETEGQPVAWFSFNSGSATTDLFFTRNYDKDWNSDLNRWGARFGVMVGEWDLSWYYFDGEAYHLQGGAGDGMQGHRAYERMLGFSSSTNLMAGVTLYSEMAGFNHNYRKYYDSKGAGRFNNEFYIQGVIGSYIVLNPESFLSFFSGDAGLTLEAYYNGSGYTQSERSNYFDTLDNAFLQGNPAVLGDYRFAGMNRIYSLAAYRNTFKEQYTTELSGLVSQDMSFLLQGQVQYNLTDYYMMKTKLTHNHGGMQTEFGNAPVSDKIEISLDVNF